MCSSNSSWTRVIGVPGWRARKQNRRREKPIARFDQGVVCERIFLRRWQSECTGEGRRKSREAACNPALPFHVERVLNLTAEPRFVFVCFNQWFPNHQEYRVALSTFLCLIFNNWTLFGNAKTIKRNLLILLSYSNASLSQTHTSDQDRVITITPHILLTTMSLALYLNVVSKTRLCIVPNVGILLFPRFGALYVRLNSVLHSERVNLFASLTTAENVNRERVSSLTEAQCKDGALLPRCFPPINLTLISSNPNIEITWCMSSLTQCYDEGIA